MSVGRVRELQPEHRGVVLRLLKSISGSLVRGLRLNDGNWEVARVAEKVVSALLGLTTRLASDDDDAAVGEGLLLSE